MKITTFSLLGCLLCCQFSCQQTPTNPRPPASNKEAAQNNSSKDKDIVYVPMEPDQTDIFAIPLDEDAFDEERELNRFEHYHPKNEK